MGRATLPAPRHSDVIHLHKKGVSRRHRPVSPGMHEWDGSSLKVAHKRAWVLASFCLNVAFFSMVGLAPRSSTPGWVYWALYAVLAIVTPGSDPMAKFVMRRDNPGAWTLAAFLASSASPFGAFAVSARPSVPLLAFCALLSAACLAHAPAAVSWSRRGVVRDVLGT